MPQALCESIHVKCPDWANLQRQEDWRLPVPGRREECVSQFFCHCDKRPDKQFKSRTYFGSWFQSILLGSVDSEFRVREDITTAGAFDRGCSIHDVQKAERECLSLPASSLPTFIPSGTTSLWDGGTHIQGRSVPRVSHLWKCPNRHTQSCGFTNILGISQSNEADKSRLTITRPVSVAYVCNPSYWGGGY
jgi:hypothetical protein